MRQTFFVGFEGKQYAFDIEWRGRLSISSDMDGVVMQCEDYPFAIFGPVTSDPPRVWGGQI